MNKHKARIRRGLKTKALIKKTLANKSLSDKTDRVKLVVYRSALHIYAQITQENTSGDKVIASCSTIDKELRASLTGKCKVEQANLVGKLLGKRANERGITKVAFDRAGYKYHGRVEALAEGAREAGLHF